MSTEQDLLSTALADRAERLDVHGPTMDDVVGRARTIRRKRRVATGVATLATIAVLTPGAWYVSSQLGQSDEGGIDPAETPSPTPTQTTADAPADYIEDGVWHRVDGTEITVPRKDYSGAVVWNDQLVASYYDGEVFFIADVITADGAVAESFDTTGPVVVNEGHTTMAWIDTDGTVQTRWAGGRVEMDRVDLSAAGETVAYTAAAVTGGPDCHDAETTGGDGCMVYVNSGVGEPTAFDSHGINESPVPGAVQYYGVADDGRLVSAVTEVTDDGSCGGVYDLDASEFRFQTCKFHVEALSPDGAHVAAPPSYYDGLGLSAISILDADTGKETCRFAPEGGFVAQWAWSEDGRLLFDTYDGANWHLMALTTEGHVEELAEPVNGSEMDSPFTLIQH